jgi:XTP/dITP diphosphohydrolase
LRSKEQYCRGEIVPDLHFANNQSGSNTVVFVATLNAGKLKEIDCILQEYKVLSYTTRIAPMEILENGKSFKENAVLKSQAVYEAMNDSSAIVIADDSGLSVPALNHNPGVYSARYAGCDATDDDNVNKLIRVLRTQKITRTNAYYTSAIAMTTSHGTVTTHGWMYGEVVDCTRGQNGFGYDPMFIPRGYPSTLGELDDDIKQTISHRRKSLALCVLLLQVFSPKSRES